MIQKFITEKSNISKSVEKIIDFDVGDTVIVTVQSQQDQAQRLGEFKGVVIRIKRKGLSSSFTVRKVSKGVGVERTFQIDSNKIESVVVVHRVSSKKIDVLHDSSNEKQVMSLLNEIRSVCLRINKNIDESVRLLDESSDRIDGVK